METLQNHEGDNGYDGTLVMIVRGDIGSSLFRPRNGNLRVYDSRARNFVPIGFRLSDVLDIVRDVTEDGGEISFPRALQELHAIRPVGNLHTAQERSEIIEQGRLCMAILLNTSGGIIDVQNQVFDAMRYVRKRGGFVATFGRKRVESAGANIFMRGNRGKRFLAPRTHMMFHLPTGDYQQEGEDGGAVNRRGEREWSGLSRRLAKWTVPRHREEMSRLLRTAESKTQEEPDRPVELSARRAEKLGFAEVCAPLREKFEEVLGIDEYRRRGAVDRFFR